MKYYCKLVYEDVVEGGTEEEAKQNMLKILSMVQLQELQQEVEVIPLYEDD